MTVVLFVISLAALERSPGFRSILLSLALGLFSLKNIVLTYLYFVDELPDIHPLMFVDALVTGAILLRLLMSGTMGSENISEDAPQRSTPQRSAPPTLPLNEEREGE